MNEQEHFDFVCTVLVFGVAAVVTLWSIGVVIALTRAQLADERERARIAAIMDKGQS